MTEPSSTRPITWALLALLAGAFCIAALVVPSRWLMKPENSMQGLPALREDAVAPEPLPEERAAQRTAEAESEVERDPPLLSTPLGADSPKQQEPPASVGPRVAVAREPLFEQEVPRSEVRRVAGLRAADAGSLAERHERVRRPAPFAAFDAGVAPIASTGAAASESELLMAEPELPPEPAPPFEQCGAVTCAAGYACCNPSCGICAAPGESCDLTPCESKVQYPVSVMCGRNTCSVGEVCCNPSCGTCVSPGESCSEELCN